MCFTNIIAGVKSIFYLEILFASMHEALEKELKRQLS